MDKPHETSWKFPVAGEDTSQAFSDQPARPILEGQDYARTSIKALNVRGIDPIVGLLRGGSRTGVTKFIPPQPNGTGLIQNLDIIVWTDPAAVGSGGGYQPQEAIDPAAESYTFNVGYVLTPEGMNIVARLLQSTPLARTSTLTNSLAILDPVVPPLADFTNASQGFQIQVSVTDGLGNVVQINGLNQIVQPLRMNLNGAVLFLGIPLTQLQWTQTFVADPGPAVFVVKVALLNALGIAIPNRDSFGTPSGGNVEQSITTPSMTALQYIPVTAYIGKPWVLGASTFPSTNYMVFQNLIIEGTASPPTLWETPSGFWAYGTPLVGPGQYTVGTLNVVNSMVTSYTAGILSLSGGGVFIDGIALADNMTVTSTGDAVTLTLPAVGFSFSFVVGIYVGYFVASTTPTVLYHALADFANTLTGGGT